MKKKETLSNNVTFFVCSVTLVAAIQWNGAPDESCDVSSFFPPFNWALTYVNRPVDFPLHRKTASRLVSPMHVWMTKCLKFNGV